MIQIHPEGNPEANLKSISHRCHPILVAFVWELTKEIIDLPLGCLQGGVYPLEGQGVMFDAPHGLGSYVCPTVGADWLLAT